MKIIKFSADYEKLPTIWEGTQARLMAVVKVDISEWKASMTAFITHDTTYREHPGSYGGHPGSYRLGEGEHLILFFIHYNTGIPFTTIRRWTNQKERYYRKAVGETFQLTRTNR